MKKLVLKRMVLLFLILGLIGCQKPASLIGLLRGNVAPNFQLENLEGKLVNLWDFRGKVVFLNFWTTWCPPCRMEMPEMEIIYQDYRAKGLEILAVNLREDREIVKAFMDLGGFSFPVLLDFEVRVGKDYQIFSLPTTFLLDYEGKIKEVFIGYQPWTDLKYRQMIENLLIKK